MYAQRAAIEVAQAEVRVPAELVRAALDEGAPVPPDAVVRCMAVLNGIDASVLRWPTGPRRMDPLPRPPPPPAAPASTRAAAGGVPASLRRFAAVAVHLDAHMYHTHVLMEASPPTAMTTDDITPALEVRRLAAVACAMRMLTGPPARSC